MNPITKRYTVWRGFDQQSEHYSFNEAVMACEALTGGKDAVFVIESGNGVVWSSDDEEAVE